MFSWLASVFGIEPKGGRREFPTLLRAVEAIADDPRAGDLRRVVRPAAPGIVNLAAHMIHAGDGAWSEHYRARPRSL